MNRPSNLEIVHELKTLPAYFELSWSDRKPFELRRADRDFRPFDLVKLSEHCPVCGYSGRYILAEITCILGPGGERLAPDHVALGLRAVLKRDSREHLAWCNEHQQHAAGGSR